MGTKIDKQGVARKRIRRRASCLLENMSESELEVYKREWRELADRATKASDTTEPLYIRGYDEGFKQGLLRCAHILREMIEARAAGESSKPVEDKVERLVRCDHYDATRCGVAGVNCRHGEEHVIGGPLGDLSCGLFTCGSAGGVKVKCVPIS